VETDTVVDDRYRLKRRLGRGGSGEVFSAWDDLLNRGVAIKFVFASDDHKDDSVGFSDLRTEAKAASGLHHKNIVSLYAIGVNQDTGNPYLVMELVTGTTLQSLVNTEGPLPVLAAVDIGIQLCEALSHAHKQGVYHRDIKPQNIMVAFDQDGRMVPKLLDFGLAKLASQNQAITATGMVMGTPWYMAPEYCLGNKYDQRCDLYSLGLVIYECLSGVQANKADNPVAAMHKAMTELPAPFSEVCPELTIPIAVQDLLARLFAKNPEDRYQSASELQKDLESIKQSLAAGTKMPVIEVPKGARTTGNRRFPTATAGGRRKLVHLCLLAVTLLSAAIAFVFIKDKLGTNVTATPNVDQSPDAWIQEGDTYLVYPKQDLKVAVDCYLKAKAGIEAGRSSAYGTGRLYDSLGNAYALLKEDDKAADCFMKATETPGQGHDAIETRANAWQGLVNLENRVGDHKKAMLSAERGLASLKDQPDTPLKAWLMTSYANELAFSGKATEAEDLLKRAMVILKRTGQMPTYAASVQRNLVICYIMEKKYAEANQLADHLVKDITRQPAFPNQLYQLTADIAQCNCNYSRYSDALRYQQIAFAECDKKANQDHKAFAGRLLCQILRAQHLNKEAEEIERKNPDILEKKHEKSDGSDQGR
jgi:tetratricopeptide (TPR) repeat protein